jgi:uncharacterized protein YjiS (DUF1127 family)
MVRGAVMCALLLLRATPCPTAGRTPRGIGWARAVLLAWQRHRAARRDLLRCAQLDLRFATDIGLTHGDIAIAARTPFRVTAAVPRISEARHLPPVEGHA